MQTVVQNLKDRYFNTDIHKVWICEDQVTATFPIWNLSGQMVGYQQYRPNVADKKVKNNPKDSRYFTHRKNGLIGVWGMESWNFSDTLFVTEGVFDACRLTAKGYSAVATLSNDTDRNFRNWFWLIRQQRKVVVICDDDPAGRKLAKLGHEYHTAVQGDLGDSTEEYVEYIIEQYT